ncbi:SURF1 family protein [Georgenia muralis]|uniref:SURF1-like protein n=1 Tax=Georgenia muralis TaxID=154117 RepID=A0A3N5A8Q4_9MICO|nr:SURF1 family protein [Georgenia muralis]RPF28041.1 cytochrome oxidase assembly protein ShyY1 [Georgenia muralis]
MSRYAFLTAPRWVRLITTMVLVSLVCVLLGAWQWSRYQDRSAQAAQVDAVHDAEPVPLGQALGRPVVDAGSQWRPVVLTGRYVGEPVLLRNRPVEGTAAVHVVAPFLADVDGEGLLVVVDRGWLPTAEAGSAPASPEGTVELVARLRLAETPQDRVAADGQVYSLDPPTVLAAAGSPPEAVGAEPLEGYVVAAEERPAADVTLGSYARPTFNYGMNLSYTIQWGLFALGALAAPVVLARREAAERSGYGPVRTGGRAEHEEDLEVLAGLRRQAALPPGRPADGRPAGRVIDAPVTTAVDAPVTAAIDAPAGTDTDGRTAPRAGRHGG